MAQIVCERPLDLPDRAVRAGSDSLLVFADDWGRHPSSCQHLMRQLLPRYRVLWVNTIGTRAPRLNLDTLRRGLGKIKQWLRPARPAARQQLPVNLRVLNPIMWPWLSSGLDRRLNAALLGRQLRQTLDQMPALPVAVTTLPIVADLMGKLPVAHWVYYCVDDFGLWPGLDQAAMQRMEREVVQRADVVIAAGENLRQRLAGMGREAHLVNHGVNLDFWSAARNPDAPAELEGLERPLIVFWGLIDRRMDVALVRRLADDLTHGTIVLAGPENDPDPGLRDIPRVRRLGVVAFERLPTLAHEAAVLIMPYADLPVTRAMQPLKLKEYLATGKPVVVRDLPANREWDDCLDLAADAGKFSDAVRLRLATGLPQEQHLARQRLDQESWQAKAQLFEDRALRSVAHAL